jgi:hypothetical protein
MDKEYVLCTAFKIFCDFPLHSRTTCDNEKKERKLAQYSLPPPPLDCILAGRNLTSRVV